MAKVSYPAPRLVDVVVVCDPKQSITHGHALYQHTVVLTLGPNDILMPDLRRLIAVFHHELSHVARIKSVGYGHTLGEAVVTEGIGIAVEEEFGGDIAQWAHFSGANHEKPTIQRFITEQGSADYDHDEWFFGGGELEPAAGYKLGYRIVHVYCVGHNIYPSKLYATTASEILSNSLIDLVPSINHD